VLTLEYLPHTLYRFYDGRGRLLYIGIAVDFLNRWRKHRKKIWWPLVARIEISSYPTRSAAMIAERSAIITEKPLHNEVHNRATRAQRQAEEAAMGVLAAYWYRLNDAHWSEVGQVIRTLRVTVLVCFNMGGGLAAVTMGVAVGLTTNSAAGYLTGIAASVAMTLGVGEIAANMCGVDRRRKKVKPMGYWRRRILCAVLFIR
jgi:hypothetical protein